MIKDRDIIRCGDVTRWHAVRVKRIQNLAEHHYNVTMIARLLAREIMGESLTAADMLMLIDYTLEHDLPELCSGDISSNCKSVLKKAGCTAALQELDYSIHPNLREIEARLEGTPLKAIAKLADMADAIVFLHMEGQGNMEARIARDSSKRLLEALIETGVVAPMAAETEATILKSLNQSVSHADSIERDLIARFEALIDRAKETYPELYWDKAILALDDLLYGSDAKLDFEYQVRDKPS